MKKNKSYLSVIILIFLLITGSLTAVKIHKYQGSGQNLDAKWTWAKNQSSGIYPKTGFWIGYSIKKMMNERTFYSSGGSYIIHSHRSSRKFFIKTTLSEILQGKKIVKDEKSELKGLVREIVYPKKSQKKILKDLAILYYFEKGSIFKHQDKIRLNSLDAPFDPSNKPIFWLGSINPEQSFNFLKGKYRQLKGEKFKKSLISMIGIHPNSNTVVPFLISILKSSESDKVRGRAALELGEHSSADSLKTLINTADKDSSLHVRQRAVYGMEDLEMPQATDALIRIAKKANHPKVRYAAINTLGDIASRKTIETLKEIVAQDEFTGVQKRAVYALEDLPADEGIPYLIKIAKTHKKMAVRRSAIHCLGDSKDPRALEALISIIKK